MCLWLPESKILEAFLGPVGAVRSTDEIAYTWFLLASTVAVLCILMAKVQGMQESGRLLHIASLAYSIGTLLTFLPDIVGFSPLSDLDPFVAPALGKPLFLAGATLSGLGFGTLMMAWGSYYIDVPLGRIKAIILSVAVIQPLVAALVDAFPILLASLALLPFLGLACLRRSFDELPRLGREPRRLPSGSVHVKSGYVAGVASISVCFGALQTLILSNGFSLEMFEGLLVAGLTALAVFAVFFTRKAEGYSSAWKLVVFVMIVGFALVAISSGSWLDKAFVVVSLGYGFFEYALWVASVDLAKYSDKPLRFVAWTFVFTIGGQGVGSLLASGLVLAAEGPQTLLVLAAGAVTVFAAAIIYLLPAGEVKTLFDPAEVKPAELGRLEKGGREALMSAYGLTQREAEVAVLLAGGRSAKRIQEELVISEGTAWTHIRHIYRKMGVSSRQEFLDAAEKLAAK